MREIAHELMARIRETRHELHRSIRVRSDLYLREDQVLIRRR